MPQTFLWGWSPDPQPTPSSAWSSKLEMLVFTDRAGLGTGRGRGRPAWAPASHSGSAARLPEESFRVDFANAFVDMALTQYAAIRLQWLHDETGNRFRHYSYGCRR